MGPQALRVATVAVLSPIPRLSYDWGTPKGGGEREVHTTVGSPGSVYFLMSVKISKLKAKLAGIA